MESTDSELQQALDLAAQGKLDEAQAILAARLAAISRIRHDLGNALAIAQASIEAMLDGVVPITDPRLNRVREILGDAGELLSKLAIKDAKEKSVFAAVSDVSSLAEAKGVELSYEDRVVSPSDGDLKNGNLETVRTILLTAVRSTPEGRSIRIIRDGVRELLLDVPSSAVNALLNLPNCAIRIVSDSGTTATLHFVL